MEALSAPTSQVSNQPSQPLAGGESQSRFRLMVVHDGYRHLDHAIEALQSRALPADTEALVLTVGDLFRTPLHLVGKEIGIARSEASAAARSRRLGRPKRTQLFFHNLEAIQRQARAKLKAAFPDWRISFEQPFGWQPNLIFLSACNQSPAGNPGLVEFIRKMSAESSVPFVVARPGSPNPLPRRLSLIAVDGPASAAAVLQSLQRGAAPKGSHFHLMFYRDPLMAHAARWSAGYEEPDREWIDSQLVRTKSAIEALGHKVSCAAAAGSSAQAILAEARRVAAESILLGTGPLACLGSLRAQSVAATVAAEAGCSVEIAFSDQQPQPAAKFPSVVAAQTIAAWKNRNDSPAGMASSMQRAGGRNSARINPPLDL